MTQPKEDPTKPEGAVAEELSEEQLDQVNGGVLIGLLLPAVQKVAVQKVRETSITDGTSNTIIF